MKRRLLFLWVLLLIVGGLLPGKAGLPVAKAQAITDIILTQTGKLNVSIYNVVTNMCSGDAGIFAYDASNNLIDSRVLFYDYNFLSGTMASIGPYNAGTRLVFYIRPWRDDICRLSADQKTIFQYVYYSDGTAIYPAGESYQSHAQVQSLKAPDSWRVDFEDLPQWWPPDFDFNDLSLIIRMEGSRTDFRQDDPEWKNTQITGSSATIGSAGCALTSAANLANWMGAAPVDPSTLHTCLGRSDVGGMVRGADDPNCTNGNSAACMAGTIHWTRVQVCTDPAAPQNSPMLMELVGKYTVGSRVVDPYKRINAIADKALLKKMIDEDLAKKQPVVVEVNVPGGVHYVVADSKKGNQYNIIDPLCGADFPTCANSKKTLSDYGDAINGIVRYEMGGKEQHRYLLIDAFAPLVDFYVVDPLNRREGRSAASGTYFNDIPFSGYDHQLPIANEITGQPQGSGMNELYIRDPLPGSYEIYITGPAFGPYNLSISFQNMIVGSGQTEPNTPQTLTTLLRGTLDANGVAHYTMSLAADSTPVFQPVPINLNQFMPLLAKGMVLSIKK